MEMHQVRYLEAVARHGSIMAASAACHVSQPSLSVQIRKLEEELGIPLLVRSPHGASLTPAGERTLASARRILREVSHLREDLRLNRYRQPPSLRVCVQPYVASEMVPAAIGESINAESSGVRFEFRERLPHHLVESIVCGGADLGIVDTSSVPVGNLACEELLRIPFALYCRQDHPLASKTQVRLSNLLSHTLILFKYSAGLEQRLAALAAQKGIELNIPFSSEIAMTAFELAASGAGATVLPLSFAKRAARRHLKLRRIADYEEFAVISAVWRPESDSASLARTFLDCIRGGRRDWDSLLE